MPCESRTNLTSFFKAASYVDKVLHLPLCLMRELSWHLLSLAPVAPWPKEYVPPNGVTATSMTLRRDRNSQITHYPIICFSEHRLIQRNQHHMLRCSSNKLLSETAFTLPEKHLPDAHIRRKIVACWTTNNARIHSKGK